MILLQAALSGDTQLQVSITDLWMMIVGVLTLAGIWFKMVYSNKHLKESIAKLEADGLNAKNGRKAIKAELTNNIREVGKQSIDFSREIVEAMGQDFKEKNAIVHSRIDKTQSDMKSYIEKSEAEFKELTKSISDVKTDTSEMKGMLKAVLDKK